MGNYDIHKHTQAHTGVYMRAYICKVLYKYFFKGLKSLAGKLNKRIDQTVGNKEFKERT